MMNCFSSCTNAEDLKKAYKRACVKLHPDNGGSTEEFQKMQNDFSVMFEKLKNVHISASGESYERTGESATTETAREFMDFIDGIINLPGLVIEIIGSWVWVSGNTKEHREVLKSFGMKFSAKKVAWYYHKEEYFKKTKKKFSMDELRNMFGSEVVTAGKRSVNLLAE